MAITSPFRLFYRGSTTFFWSSRFFPKMVRHDITTLYAFVRYIDNLVDIVPQQKEMFYQSWNEFKQARVDQPSPNMIINNAVALERTYRFKPAWFDSFFQAMEYDLTAKTYATLADVKRYIYGSANIIGLCLANMLNLPRESYLLAEKLGLAYQYINFIRDINEDNQLGRTYFPQTELARYGLSSLSISSITNNEPQFKQFIQQQIKRFYAWLDEAEVGYRYIPKNYLIPIKTASDMYRWTATEIAKDPMVIYGHKVKPPVWRVILAGINNTAKIGL